MYLKNIKLAGFKSFVDPTMIPIKSHMSAIVGPNGCGKSNIVDAVRWVIGEISAKQLRGKSMSDVIFNGTSTRKPVGKAMVELVFDNNEGRIGGEYAKYSEISVRRECERDDSSKYFLNGHVCLRKHILDIFLGTGLGPRSYAIIEQGMVTRLIEAKPEEMRVYFEEVAGISKYKERRRETKNRIDRTQENLDRLNDLREELTKQLRHLKRQANAALRYQEYKNEEKLHQAQIKTLQWQQLASDRQSQEDQIRQLQLHYEEKMTEQRHTETEIEKARIWQGELNEKQNTVQKEYYGLGAEIARIEQQIQHAQEQAKQWKEELEEAEKLWEEINDNAQDQQQQITEISAEIENLMPNSQDTQSKIIESQQRLDACETNMRQCQEEWEQFQHQHSQNQQMIEVAKTKIEHYQQQCDGMASRMETLRSNQDADLANALKTEIEPLSLESQKIRDSLSQLNEGLEAIANEILQKRENNQTLTRSIETARQELHTLQSRYASLDALQKMALGENDEHSKKWLEQQQLNEKPRLGKLLRVNSGWELAVETVLSGYFDALCVDDIDKYIENVAQGSLKNLTLIAHKNHDMENTSTTPSANTLQSQINSEIPLGAWIKEIFIAENVQEAMQIRQSLSPQQSVITKNGVWIAKNWLRVSRANPDEGGVIVREKELDVLVSEIEALQKNIIRQQEQLLEGENELNQLEEKRDRYHAQYQETTSQLTETQAILTAKQSRLTELQQQQERIIKELHDCEQRSKEFADLMEKEQQVLAQCMQKQSHFHSLKEQLKEQRETYQLECNEARQIAQRNQQAADELAIRLASNQNQLSILKQSVSHADKQQKQLSERREVLLAHLSEKDAPSEKLSEELQILLAKQQEIEKHLHEVENELQAQTQQLKTLESNKNELVQKVNDISQQLQELRLERQTIEVRQTNLQEQVQELAFEFETVLQELPPDASLDTWQEKADILAKKISRLGPINLAAIEEHESVNERKEYLDKQLEDLEEALKILHNAMHKIDRETKEKFRDTFEKVNEKFQSIFPRIFGGGKAGLELETQDLLTTGVIVRAQPPGKKNVNIHMLSGGEKALSAISLVFALFQLNPAPFCILDEVDAPLDDINVGRYCQLVKEMSLQTQFIVISHNKVTIEMADYLMGVTMQEAGVSRLVSVDMAQAIEMASEAVT